MKRFFILVYGLLAYFLFLAVFGYMAGFLLGFLVPKGIDDPGHLDDFHPFTAVLINLTLVALFGVLHSILARDWAKAWLYRVLPAAAERSTFVLQSSLCLALAMWAWQPLTGTIWQVDGVAAMVIYAGFAVGVGIVLWSTFLIDHFELFGLRQIWCSFTRQAMPEPTFRTPALYGFVRHPMQLGIVILLFATPHMTWGHALFAGSMTAYIFVGLYFEERALRRAFGERYVAYQSTVPMLFPSLRAINSYRKS